MIKDGILNTSGEILSFLLIGQSNMAGRGEFNEVEPILNPSCYMLRMGRWQKMSEPINPDRPIFEGKTHSGTSLAASFADGMARLTGKKIGLIPCADGGTRISQWMPGEILFEHAVMMTRLAMRTSRLAGILWHQGESDCHSDENLTAHAEAFFNMITALRCELRAEGVPLLIGELSDNISEAWNVADRPQKMNLQYRALAKRLSPCTIVSAKGLELKPDGLHFNSKSLRIFGERYLDAYREIAGI